MPSPRPPRLSGRPSSHELKRAAQQIARSQRLTAGGGDGLQIVQGPTGFHISRDTSKDPFTARLTAVYTPSSGAQNGINLYSFIEQSADQTSGIPQDFAAGRQTLGSSPPTSAYALEINNALLTVPGSTPTGYPNPGPYVDMRLRGYVAGVPVYEFFAPPSVLAKQTANLAAYSLTSSWSNIGTSLTLPANSTWLLTAQINAEIISGSTGAGDSISCRFYDGSAVAGCPVELCNAVCDSLTFVDAASLVAVYAAGSSGATVDIQGIVNTGSGSTGSILGCGSTSGGQLVGVRLS